MGKMSRDEMMALIKAHWAAEERRDVKGVVDTLGPDVVHDVVGFPGGAIRGPQAAAERYSQIFPTLKTTNVTFKRHLFGDDFIVEEAEMEGIAEGRFLGLDGRNRPVKFRILHVWGFGNGKINHEQVWLDAASIHHQLP